MQTPTRLVALPGSSLSCIVPITCIVSGTYSTRVRELEVSSQIAHGCKVALILFLVVLAGCSTADNRHTGFYSVGDPSKGEFNKVVTISNPGSADASFRLSIKGFLFGSKEELLEYISSMPDLYAGEPSYEKAWRFMTKRSYAHVPYTGSTRVHDPLLYLNSVG